MPRTAALLLLLPLTLGFDGPDARQALDRAFDNLYGVSVLAGIELFIDDRGAESRVRFAYSRKSDERETRTLIHLMDAPETTRTLLLQKAGKRDQIFISQGARGRVQLASSGQDVWPLLGSDFGYEDIRAKRADDYRIEVLGPDRVQGEPCRALRLRPFQGPYQKLVVWLSTERPVIVRIDYFDPKGLWKRYSADVEEIAEQFEWWVPMRDEMLNLRTGRRTRRYIRNIMVDAAVPDEMFTTTQLGRRRHFPAF